MYIPLNIRKFNALRDRKSVLWFEVNRQPRSKRPGCWVDNEFHKSFLLYVASTKAHLGI